jgi:hypothetical protein
LATGLGLRAAALGVGLCAVAVAGWPGAAVFGQIPEGWEVVRVTNDSFYDGPPAINCMGQVVWSKRLAGFDGEEIFMRDVDGTVIRITDDNVRDAFPDINDDGVIVWSRAVGPGGRFEIAMHRDGETRLLTNNGQMNWGPRVNNQGRVVWHQDTGRGCSGKRILLLDEQGTRVVYDGDYSNQVPIINDLDEIVWTRYDFCQSPWRGTPMYRTADGELIELTDGSDQGQAPFVNNRSQIAWGSDPDGVILWESGKKELITDWGHAADINDRGVVSINRWHEELRAWQVWLWVNGELVRITDEPYWNNSADVNESGELAWEHGNPGQHDVMMLTWNEQNGDIDATGSVDAGDYRVLAPCIGGPDRRVDGCACHRSDLAGC